MINQKSHVAIKKNFFFKAVRHISGSQGGGGGGGLLTMLLYVHRSEVAY